jgi:hypothetical protein
MINSINLDGVITLISRAILSGIVVNFIREKDRQIRQPFYRRSDLFHKARYGFKKWFPLDEDLEYSFQISTPDYTRPTQIAIKNIGKSIIESVSINIVAKKCFDGVYRDYLYDRQERLEFLDLDPQKVVKQYLNNIPPDDVWLIKDTGAVISSYQSISIHLLSKEKDRIIETCNDVARPIFCSRRFEDLERRHWETHWGEKYNVQLLNDLKRDFLWKIGGRLEWWFLCKHRGIPQWSKQMAKPFLALILNKISLDLFFWIFLFSGHISLEKYE